MVRNNSLNLVLKWDEIFVRCEIIANENISYLSVEPRSVGLSCNRVSC